SSSFNLLSQPQSPSQSIQIQSIPSQSIQIQSIPNSQSNFNSQSGFIPPNSQSGSFMPGYNPQPARITKVTKMNTNGNIEEITTETYSNGTVKEKIIEKDITGRVVKTTETVRNTNGIERDQNPPRPAPNYNPFQNHYNPFQNSGRNMFGFNNPPPQFGMNIQPRQNDFDDDLNDDLNFMNPFRNSPVNRRDPFMIRRPDAMSVNPFRGFDIFDMISHRQYEHPADKRAVNELKSFKLTDISKLNEEKKNCSICLEPFQINESVITLPCFHIFHEKCILKWLETQNFCPICRFKIEDQLGGGNNPFGGSGFSGGNNPFGDGNDDLRFAPFI
ncbi:MAG: hypothetical protein MJ252_21995, partial [archaeon]|nr:hypothetical protein [archaeon]